MAQRATTPTSLGSASVFERATEVGPDDSNDTRARTSTLTEPLPAAGRMSVSPASTPAHGPSSAPQMLLFDSRDGGESGPVAQAGPSKQPEQHEPPPESDEVAAQSRRMAHRYEARADTGASPAHIGVSVPPPPAQKPHQRAAAINAPRSEPGAPSDSPTTVPSAHVRSPRPASDLSEVDPLGQALRAALKWTASGPTHGAAGDPPAPPTRAATAPPRTKRKPDPDTHEPRKPVVQRRPSVERQATASTALPPRGNGAATDETPSTKSADSVRIGSIDVQIQPSLQSVPARRSSSGRTTRTRLSRGFTSVLGLTYR